MKQEMLSESSTENWMLSQAMQSDKKYRIVKSSQTEKENLSENQKINIFKVVNEFYSEI